MEWRAGQKLTEETLRKKRNILNPLVVFCDERGQSYPRQINFEDLTDFRTRWKDQALSSAKKLERLKGFFRFCVDAPLDQRESGFLPFTRAQMSRLLTTCDQYPNNYGRTEQGNALPLRTMLLVLRYTGLRIRDAVQLAEAKFEPDEYFFGPSRKQANRFLFLFLCS